MPNSELRRPSTWLFAIGVAFGWVGLRVVADLEAGRALQGTLYYVCLWLGVFGWMLVAVTAVYGLIIFVALLPRLFEVLRQLVPVKKAPVIAAPAAVRYTRIIPGTVMGRPTTLAVEDLRPARWVAWNDTALEVLAWYRVTGSLIYSVMAGRDKAFVENKDAQTVYVEMARLGLVNLVNGKQTTLADSLPSVLAAIRSGRLDWRDDADPPAIRPAPKYENRVAGRDEDD